MGILNSFFKVPPVRHPPPSHATYCAKLERQGWWNSWVHGQWVIWPLLNFASLEANGKTDQIWFYYRGVGSNLNVGGQTVKRISNNYVIFYTLAQPAHPAHSATAPLYNDRPTKVTYIPPPLSDMSLATAAAGKT